MSILVRMPPRDIEAVEVKSSRAVIQLLEKHGYEYWYFHEHNGEINTPVTFKKQHEDGDLEAYVDGWIVALLPGILVSLTDEQFKAVFERVDTWEQG